MVQPKQTDPQFKLRLPLDTKEDIERHAKLNNRSINSEIVARLEFSFCWPELSTDDWVYFRQSADEHGVSVADEIMFRLLHTRHYVPNDVFDPTNPSARQEREHREDRLDTLEKLVRAIAIKLDVLPDDDLVGDEDIPF